MSAIHIASCLLRLSTKDNSGSKPQGNRGLFTQLVPQASVEDVLEPTMCPDDGAEVTTITAWQVLKRIATDASSPSDINFADNLHHHGWIRVRSYFILYHLLQNNSVLKRHQLVITSTYDTIHEVIACIDGHVVDAIACSKDVAHFVKTYTNAEYYRDYVPHNFTEGQAKYIQDLIRFLDTLYRLSFITKKMFGVSYVHVFVVGKDVAKHTIEIT